MGGGEKVLYKMLEGFFGHQSEIEAKTGKKIHIGIYCAANATPHEILTRVKVFL